MGTPNDHLRPGAINAANQSAEINTGAMTASAQLSPHQMALELDALAERYKPGSTEGRTFQDAAEMIRRLNGKMHDEAERAEIAEDRAARLANAISLARLALGSVSFD